MVKTILTTITVLFCGCELCCGVSSIEPQEDFYTPMSTMIISGRDYILTSNCYAWLDMGSGSQSFETMMFLKFEDNSLPSEECQRVWLRLASGAGGSMGSSNRAIFVSVSPTDMDVLDILNGDISPRDFYVNNDHVLEPVAGKFVYQDGVCYWDITEIVNSWILFEQSGGVLGYENNGLAITGRQDAGAIDSSDNQHCGFWSSEAVEGDEPMPHSVAPALIFTDAPLCFDQPWIPDWSNLNGYTCQFWQLSGADGIVSQPLAPDSYCDNSFGEPNLIWEEETVIGGEEIINPFLKWHPYPDSSNEAIQPCWADGVYGGLYRGTEYQSHCITATIPTSGTGDNLTVYVQYDWYNRGNAEVRISGAVDVTAENFYDYEIANCGNGFSWQRTTKIFELSNDSTQLEVVFSISGDEPYIDSISVTTAIDAFVDENVLRLAEDIDMNGRVDNYEFSNFALRWFDSSADYSELVELADMWLESSGYIWKY